MPFFVYMGSICDKSKNYTCTLDFSNSIKFLECDEFYMVQLRLLIQKCSYNGSVDDSSKCDNQNGIINWEVCHWKKMRNVDIRKSHGKETKYKCNVLIAPRNRHSNTCF